MSDYHTIHAEACEAGALHYLDPNTGYRVFTALSLKKRESCCGCGCRHCPFGHSNVAESSRLEMQRDPWIVGSLPEPSCDLLFWSGGKDSFLALRSLQREAARPVVLCTTFDGRTEIVAHQNISVQSICEQVAALNLSIVLIPLYPDHDYLARVELGIRTVRRQLSVERLVFGDLHLEHIRSWREDQFSTRFPAEKLYFPLWKVSYSKLMDDLFQSNATFAISSITSEECASLFSVGDPFDRDLIAKLPESVDAFGENGEFHTIVRVSSS